MMVDPALDLAGEFTHGKKLQIHGAAMAMVAADGTLVPGHLDLKRVQ